MIYLGPVPTVGDIDPEGQNKLGYVQIWRIHFTIAA